MNIEICINTNNYSGKDVQIDSKDIMDFTRNMCDCAYKYAQRDGKMSENNDGYSVSYDTGKSLDSMLYEIAEVYLVNTGLMSLAVDDNADECNDYNL